MKAQQQQINTAKREQKAKWEGVYQIIPWQKIQSLDANWLKHQLLVKLINWLKNSYITSNLIVGLCLYFGMVTSTIKSITSIVHTHIYMHHAKQAILWSEKAKYYLASGEANNPSVEANGENMLWWWVLSYDRRVKSKVTQIHCRQSSKDLRV